MIHLIHIQPATLENVPSIAKLARQYPAELGFVMTVSLKESVARNTLLVATLYDSVVAFVNYRARKDGWHTIYEIAVHKNYTGMGVGKALIDYMPKPIRLKTTQDNEGANAFYKHLGFTLLGIEQGRKRPLNVYTLGSISHA